MKKTLMLMATLAACLLGRSVVNADTISYTISDEEAAAAATTANFGDFGCAINDCNTCDDSWHLGLVAPSDHCFDSFISPMTNPVYFEDPRTLSEARFIYAHHVAPIGAGGGDIDLFALQLRAAVNDRLSIIATKDGFMTSSNALIQDGWADVNAGIKYNLYRDECCQQLLSAGLTYELPVGSTRAQQGNGDGTFHLFTTGGMQIGNGHWLSAFGWVVPADSAAESEWIYWSNHFDRRWGCTNLFPFYELNWYHYVASGAGGIPGVEGGDLFNFGSTGVTGNNIVTNAIGMKYKPSNNTEVGIAWEFPLTQRRDVLDNRLTFDFIIRY